MKRVEFKVLEAICRMGVPLLAVLLTAMASAGDDWEGDLLEEEEAGTFHTMVGVTWDSQYVWRGFDLYDGESVTHLSADINLFETGFGVSAVGHFAGGGGLGDRERWDGTAYYQSGLFPGTSFATNYRIGYVYYLYPDLNVLESTDQQEGQLVLSWPNILPIQGLQPSYVLIKMWPSHSDSPLSDSASGWMHIGMLDYGFSVPGIIPEIPEHIITLHAELVYNDGLTVTPPLANDDWPAVSWNPDHDFSHFVLGASTDFAFGEDSNLVFTPSVYYQNTLNDSINEDDSEVWVSIALKYMF